MYPKIRTLTGLVHGWSACRTALGQSGSPAHLFDRSYGCLSSIQELLEDL